MENSELILHLPLPTRELHRLRVGANVEVRAKGRIVALREMDELGDVGLKVERIEVHAANAYAKMAEDDT